MSLNKLYLSFFVLLLYACAGGKQLTLNNYGSPTVEQTLIDENTFKITEYSKEKSYGYSKKNPVMVGGINSAGPKNQHRFLNALAGPKGEKVYYIRKGSCCQFTTTNSPFEDQGMLDIYEVRHDGLKEPVILYLNLYDSDTLKVPMGFTLSYD